MLFQNPSRVFSRLDLFAFSAMQVIQEVCLATSNRGVPGAFHIGLLDILRLTSAIQVFTYNLPGMN